jgi:stage II sporulation protein D
MFTPGPLRFDVINDVDVDSYLMSVVTGEMPRTFADEAYKAQAIVARTYALYEARTTGAGRNFDLFDDTKSQVYAGLAAETDRSRAAVAETSGIVVAAGPPGQERIFKAYFSSCCGGVGQSATDAFNDPPSRELTEQNVGALCNESPHFNWAPIELSKAELTRRIRAWGEKRGHAVKNMAMLDQINIFQVNKYGRPVRFLLIDVRGQRYSLSGEETRWACDADPRGGPTLLSSFFKPINGPDTVRFSDGHGSGHGVGMCQWCAQARAEKGMRHEDIVLLSYPGAKLVRAY